MGSVYIVRHGQTDWNLQRRLQGQQNPKLNNVGRTLAGSIATYFMHHAQNIDLIYSSTLDRAVETATIIARYLHLPVRFSVFLREMCFGKLEGKLESEVSDELAKFLAKKSLYKFPEGESYDDVSARVHGVTSKIRLISQTQNVVVVGHQGVNRAILGSLLQLPKKTFVKIDQPHHVIFEITQTNMLVSHDVHKKIQKPIFSPLE